MTADEIASTPKSSKLRGSKESEDSAAICGSIIAKTPQPKQPELSEPWQLVSSKTEAPIIENIGPSSGPGSKFMGESPACAKKAKPPPDIIFAHTAAARSDDTGQPPGYLAPEPDISISSATSGLLFSHGRIRMLPLLPVLKAWGSVSYALFIRLLILC